MAEQVCKNCGKPKHSKWHTTVNWWCVGSNGTTSYEPAAPEAEPPAVPPAQEEVSGQFECPLCGTSGPHEHSGEDIVKHRVASAVISDTFDALNAAISSLDEWRRHYDRQGWEDSCARYEAHIQALQKLIDTQPSPQPALSYHISEVPQEKKPLTNDELWGQPSPQPAGAEPKIDDDELLRLAAKTWGNRSAGALYFTRWKDGIDIEMPSPELRKFVEGVLAHAQLAALRKSQQECDEALRNAAVRVRTIAAWKGEIRCSDIAGEIDIQEIETALANAAKLEGK